MCPRKLGQGPVSQSSCIEQRLLPPQTGLVIQWWFPFDYPPSFLPWQCLPTHSKDNPVLQARKTNPDIHPWTYYRFRYEESYTWLQILKKKKKEDRWTTMALFSKFSVCQFFKRKSWEEVKGSPYAYVSSARSLQSSSRDQHKSLFNRHCNECPQDSDNCVTSLPGDLL